VKLSIFPAFAIICSICLATCVTQSIHGAEGDQEVLQMDRAAFGPGNSSGVLSDDLLDKDCTWTDSAGSMRNKSEILRAMKYGKGLSNDVRGANDATTYPSKPDTLVAHTYGRVGLVQESEGKLYILRVWVRRPQGWRLLVYQAVLIGTPASADPRSAGCQNPCRSVPFRPKNVDESNVIQAYQAVERAVAAHDSAAWGQYIAAEFFAVTSNSDRPLDKASRMAGLDQLKVGGIAPFPLVSARMLEFGDAMVMTSRQQPEHGLPLHVTRVWFKRGGAWLEAYSYQTTIQSDGSPR